MHYIRFQTPDPAVGAHGAPPDPLAGFERPISNGMGTWSEGERERDARGDSGWEGERGGEEDGKGRQERIGDEREGGLPPLEWRSGYAPARNCRLTGVDHVVGVCRQRRH